MRWLSAHSWRIYRIAVSAVGWRHRELSVVCSRWAWWSYVVDKQHPWAAVFHLSASAVYQCWVCLLVHWLFSLCIVRKRSLLVLDGFRRSIWSNHLHIHCDNLFPRKCGLACSSLVSSSTWHIGMISTDFFNGPDAVLGTESVVFKHWRKENCSHTSEKVPMCVFTWLNAAELSMHNILKWLPFVIYVKNGQKLLLVMNLSRIHSKICLQILKYHLWFSCSNSALGFTDLLIVFCIHCYELYACVQKTGSV